LDGVDVVKLVKLKDICEFEKGSTGLAKAEPGEYPLVTTGAERKSSNTYQFDTKAVCIPLVSSTGHGHASLKNVHYQEGKFALGTILVALTTKNESKLDIQFLHLYLSQLKDQVLVSLMSGAANVALSVAKIQNIQIPLPPLEKQQEIVRKFKSIVREEDELKSELTHQQALLKKLRQQILQEAIEGKLTSEWRTVNPDVEPASELLKLIAAEKAQLIKDKKINPLKSLPCITDDEKPFGLPEGWAWCRLGNVMDQLTDYYANGSYEILKKHTELLDKPNFAIMLRTTNFHKKSKFNYKYITKEAYEFLEKIKGLSWRCNHE
jgi:type I restriction enzyme, S subunit